MNIVQYIIKAMYIHVAVKQMWSSFHIIRIILPHKMCPCEKYFLWEKIVFLLFIAPRKPIKLNPVSSISVGNED